jgi:hypothetical protein
MLNSAVRIRKLKTCLLSVTLLGSLTLQSNLAHAQAAQDFKPSSPVAVLMPVVIDNLDTLELNPEQISQVRQIARTNFSQVEYINAQYHNVKTQLQEETLGKDGQQASSLKLIDELGEIDKKRMQLTIECVFGLKAILTPQQYAELMAIVAFNKGQ